MNQKFRRAILGSALILSILATIYLYQAKVRWCFAPLLLTLAVLFVDSALEALRARKRVQSGIGVLAGLAFLWLGLSQIIPLLRAHP